MNDSNEIGARIKKLREDRGITQQELSKKLYVKRETITQWENGTRDLKTEYTIKLADFFGVTCDEILRGIKSENVEINKRFGLTDEAVKQLSIYSQVGDNSFTKTINTLLENLTVLGTISKYLYYELEDPVQKKYKDEMKEYTPMVPFRVKYKYLDESREPINPKTTPIVDADSHHELISNEIYKKIIMLDIQEELFKLLNQTLLNA